MRVRKTIKKIASVGAAVGMMGATLMGAAMADLSEWPGMYITDSGQFDGLLVVGASASAEDVIGITNIAMALQAAAVTTEAVDAVSEGTRTTVSEGVELCDRDLFMGLAIADCEVSVDDAELPVELADEIYHDTEGENDNDETYTQEILFQDNNTGTLVFEQDDDDAPLADVYLFIDDSNNYFYNFSLKFDDRVDYDNTSTSATSDDLEGTTLYIQGNPYTITNVKLSSNTLEEIEMQAGESTVWMSEGETLVRTIDGVEHTIEMIDVTSNADEDTGSCGFEVDGSTLWVDVDDTDSANGVTLGVIDAKAVNIEAQDQDVCQVVIGAQEVKLVDGDEIEINDEDVDGTLATVTEATTGDASTGRWTGFNVAFAPDTDEVYLAPGDEYVDPIFGNLKFVFGGVNTGGVETIEFISGSTDGLVRFTNEDGREVELPLCADENSPGGAGSESNTEYMYWGEDAPTTSDRNEDELMYLQAETCSGDNADVTNCQGAMFLVVTATTNEAHLVEITNIDVNDNQVDFRDLTYGTEDKDVIYTTDDGTAANTMNLGSGIGDITLTINETGGWVTFSSIGSGAGQTIETLEEGFLMIINSDTGNQTFDGMNFTEGNDGDLGAGNYLNGFIVTAWYDDQDDSTIEFNYSSLAATNGYGWVDESEDNDDFIKFFTNKGTLITIDQEDKQSVVIEHPHDAVYGEVYIAPTDATQITVAGDGAVSQQVQEISVNAVKLDTEVSDALGSNLVAVGGPCANSVVAELMENPAVCEDALGISSGQALIKLFENDGNYALVVAGQDAMDTRLASEIVANWDDYELTGTEMVATTVSASSLTVEAVE
jgi:hypothetical protein